MRGLALALRIAVAGAAAAVAQPAAALATSAAPSPDQVAIPFDPPLGQRLVYRMQRRSEPGDRGAPTQFFTLEFVRAPDGYLMTVTPADADGSPLVLRAMPAPLASQTFRVAPDGRIVEMLGEEAYWRAVEDLIRTDARDHPEDADAEGSLWAVRQTRGLPNDARMRAIADNGWQILAYAGHTVEPGRVVQDTGSDVTVAGTIDRIERTIVEAVSDERISILFVSTAPIEQLSAAVGEVSQRFGRTPQGLGGRLVGSEARHSFVIDRRTGLAFAYRSVTTMTTEEGGQRRAMIFTVSIERVDDSTRQR